MKVEELFLNRLELSEGKIDAMDVDEVEAITKPILAEESEGSTKASAALIKENLLLQRFCSTREWSVRSSQHRYSPQ